VVIPKDDKEFPSENEELKKGTASKLVLNLLTMISDIVAMKIAITKNISQDNETLAAMPIVIAPKYTESSNGERTGFLNRTIDNAPTIPNDRAMFPEIKLVIT
jgi:N-acetylmuramic acid 6-phosphate (MurNAc-6-P) etherase